MAAPAQKAPTCFLAQTTAVRPKPPRVVPGLKGDFPLGCSADRSRGGGKEDRGASYRLVCGTRGRKGRKEGSVGLARQFMATGNNAAVGRQRVLSPSILPPYVGRTPAATTELARLYGPRLTSHSPFLLSGRVVSPVGYPQGNFPTGATTSDRLSALARFGERKGKYNATCFLHIPSKIEIYRTYGSKFVNEGTQMNVINFVTCLLTTENSKGILFE